MSRRKVSAAEVLLAAPAYVAAAALFVIAALQVSRGMEPGVNPEDIRPAAHIFVGFGALTVGIVLISLGYFAAKRPAVASSLAITTSLAVALMLFMLLAASKTETSTRYLVVAGLFAYPAAVAILRVAGLRRRERAPRS